jgi:hypothetical protein
LQEGSITLVKVIVAGSNFLSGGVLRVTGGGGSGFSGGVQVDSNGALTRILISDHGSGFTSDPDSVSLYYNGTNVNMVSRLFMLIEQAFSSLYFDRFRYLLDLTVV